MSDSHWAAAGAGPWRRTRYRLLQFGRGLAALLHPRVAQAEIEQARSILPAPAFSLFAALPVDAQRHSLNVLQALELEGAPSPDLAAAALLHDAGKLEAQRAGWPITLWMRGPLVLAEALAPERVAKVQRDSPASRWRYAVWVHRHHPAIGAEWAEAAGCSAQTVWLIRHHAEETETLSETTDPVWRAELERLQRADGSN